MWLSFPSRHVPGCNWPYYEGPEIEPAVAASDRLNCEGLVSLLQSIGDSIVELYGIWDGDFAEAPKAFETIPVETILSKGFRFKERGSYKDRMMLD
jgi:hypothetical protein